MKLYFLLNASIAVNMLYVAPVMTEEVTQTLEQLILQRVKDRVWNDVVRKEKPAQDPFSFKKKLVLDQEKSKLSLAQIYEQVWIINYNPFCAGVQNFSHFELFNIIQYVDTGMKIPVVIMCRQKKEGKQTTSN